jgi:predicted DNA repair protein MutK
MRRIAVVVALNLVAAAAYGFVAVQMGFFSHMGETLFSSPDSLGYRDVGDWLFRAIPNSVESVHRPFLYPLLLGGALRIGGNPAIWALNLVLWFGTVNVTAAATWRMTARPLLGAIVFLVLATNVSLIVLSFQALTELTVAFLESIWIFGLALIALPPSGPREACHRLATPR